ncbi:DUF3899 domain-containing protein [Staphylococcus borealis]|uniref:DUF3899 domain-containing protein n=1 Tax=Staphylococcus borealis TaxID=2742203 RepID=UPI0025A2F898|nr:DUF3899 domain-containing protein [Staphylococcus borealis]MDM7862769.1 DUF3899 domain-containing protein [Staphylococcus borealis]MDM7881528.1 DUF3899 domain-containing protein [Staphylococcus borealis]
MKHKKSWGLWLLSTPMITLIIWLIFSNHSFISYINTLFYLSLIIFILVFIILLVQEGIFDATSYGFRRIRYQMASRAKKKTMEHDAFFNPSQVKKEVYFISSWIFPALIINSLYFVLTIIISIFY